MGFDSFIDDSSNKRFVDHLNSTAGRSIPRLQQKNQNIKQHTNSNIKNFDLLPLTI